MRSIHDERIDDLKRRFRDHLNAFMWEDGEREFDINGCRELVVTIFGWIVGRSPSSHLMKGILLYGDFGTGKSVILKATIAMIRELYAGNIPNAIPSPIYTTGIEMGYAYKDNDTQVINRIITSRVAAIDDFDKSPRIVKYMGTDLNPFADIVSLRYDRKNYLLLTTNLHPSFDPNGKETIADIYGAHTEDRLRQMCLFIRMTGGSKRV